MIDDDFFAEFKSPSTLKVATTNSHIKSYPAWVEQHKKPDKVRYMYDVVQSIYEVTKARVLTNDFTNIRDVTISNAQICRALGKSDRSHLKNYPLVVDLIVDCNKKIEQLIERASNRVNKSLIRKNKSQIKAELEKFRGKHEAKTQVELERLLNSEVLISFGDASQKIEQQKLEIVDLRREIAELKHANSNLQNFSHELQKRLFDLKLKQNNSVRIVE